MTDQEKQEMDGLRAKLVAAEKEALDAKESKRQLELQQHQVLAVGTVSRVLREAEIPYSVSLLNRACASPVVKEGKLDEDWLKGIVADFTEGQQGRITAAGHVKEEDKTKAGDEITKMYKESFKTLGVPDAGLEIASMGRV